MAKDSKIEKTPQEKVQEPRPEANQDPAELRRHQFWSVLIFQKRRIENIGKYFNKLS